jgi:hypothetical protein
LSSESCIQKNLSSGFGNPNVSLRLNSLLTRNMLRRREKFSEEGYNYVLCQDNMEETVEHLFFGCPSAACKWLALGFLWNEGLNIHH